MGDSLLEGNYSAASAFDAAAEQSGPRIDLELVNILDLLDAVAAEEPVAETL